MKAVRDRVEKVVLRTSKIWTVRDPVTICMLRTGQRGASVDATPKSHTGERELTM